MRARLTIGGAGLVKGAVIAAIAATLLAVIPGAEGQNQPGWYVTAWVPPAPPALFSRSAAFDGSRAVVGAPFAIERSRFGPWEGRLVTYEPQPDGTWASTAVLAPPSGMDPIGYGTQVVAEPGRVVVSNAPEDASPQLAVLDGADLAATVIALPVEPGGYVSHLDLDGDRIVASTGPTPQVLVIERAPDGTWSSTALPGAGDSPSFAGSFGLAAEGDLVVSTDLDDTAVLWTRTTEGWVQSTITQPGEPLGSVAIVGRELFTLSVTDAGQLTRHWTAENSGVWSSTTLNTQPHTGSWGLAAADGIVATDRLVLTRQADGSWTAEPIQGPADIPASLRLVSNGDYGGGPLLFVADSSAALVVVERTDTPPDFSTSPPLTGRIVTDLDLDGVADPDEPGRAGLELRIDSTQSFDLGRAQSGSDGSFSFAGTSPFTCYRVTVVSPDPVLASFDEGTDGPQAAIVNDRCTTGVASLRPITVAVADASARLDLSAAGFPVASDGTVVVSPTRELGQPGVTLRIVTPEAGGYRSETITATADLQRSVRGIAVQGDRIAVTEYPGTGSDGHVRIYDRTATGWAETRVTIPAAPSLDIGTSIALDGDRIVVGAFDVSYIGGATYVLDRSADGSWAVTSLPDPGHVSGYLGNDVDVSGDRLIVAVGSTGAGAPFGAYLYERAADGSWSWRWLAADGQMFGQTSVAIDGDLAAMSGSGVAVFSLGDGTWPKATQAHGVRTGSLDIDGGRVFSDAGIVQPGSEGRWTVSWFAQPFDAYTTPQVVALSGTTAVMAQNGTLYRVDLGEAPAPAPPATVGGRVWYDDDRDGFQDPSESGVPGLGVHLLDPSSPFGAAELAAVETDDDGGYQFDGLDGARCTTVVIDVPFAFPDQWTESPIDVGSDDTTDSDGTRTTICPAVDGTVVDHDAGLIRPQAAPPRLGSITSRAWSDTDADGVQDDSEPGLEGVEIGLFDPEGRPVASGFAVADGTVDFDNLPVDACYEMRVVAPDGMRFTPRDVGDDGAYEDTIDSDADVDGTLTPWACLDQPFMLDQDWFDAGLVPGDADPVAPSDGIVSGQVWHDANGDGVQQFDREVLAEGTEVTLWQVDWSDGDPRPALAGTTTTRLGTYKFTGLRRDICYQVRVSIPDGHRPTLRNAGDDGRVADTLDSDLRDDGWLTPYACISAGALRTQSWWDAGLIPVT